MHFDASDNLYISNLSPRLHVYDKEYQYNRTITYADAERIEGWVFQCDGGKVLSDRTGKVIFVDKDDNLLQVHMQGFSELRNVAITESGALFVIDFQANKMLIY